MKVFSRMSIRWRLTCLSILMLTFCCVGLTIVLNFSAFQYMRASSTIPATNIEEALVPFDSNTMQAIPLQGAIEAREDFGIESILYMLAFVIGGGALMYGMLRKSLKPLDILNTQVKNMTVMKLAQPIELPLGNDEIRQLTQSFNDMSNNLHNAFMLQQRFSASAAHELRTPLAVLQTKIDVFKKKNSCTMDEYDALIAIFEKQTYKLRMLIKNLLEMTMNDETSEQSKVCLKDVFEEIILDLKGIAKDKQVQIFLHCDESSVIGNIDLLYRAFYNLIENGINYNIQNGNVSIVVAKVDNKQVEIRISDSGIGMSADEKKRIFEPFYQVDKNRINGGVGLGLAIVDNIIKKHQSRIEIEDVENGGTCFKMIFKLSS